MQTVENPTALESEQDGSARSPKLLRLSVFVKRYSPQFGIPCLVLFLFSPARPLPESWVIYAERGVGISLAVVGLVLRICTRGFQRKQGFVLNGPYRYLRNPVEVGAVLGMLGLGIVLVIPYWYLGICAVLAIAVMSLSAVSTELDLTQKLGGAYLRYSKRVARWVPSLLPGINRVNQDFSIKQALILERDTIWWLLGFALVYGLRTRFFTGNWGL